MDHKWKCYQFLSLFLRRCAHICLETHIFYDKKRVVGNVLGRVSASFLVHQKFYFLNQSPFSLKVQSNWRQTALGTTLQV